MADQCYVLDEGDGIEVTITVADDIGAESLAAAMAVSKAAADYVREQRDVEGS